jgi:hypothetical protein
MKGGLGQELGLHCVQHRSTATCLVAADESLLMARSMGREQLDLATLHATIANFVEPVDFLCKRGGRMAVESSFTQHCLTLLSTRQLQVLERGTYRVLPSPSDQQVQKCILRISKWADMAKAVVEAEFPDFLVLCLCFRRRGESRGRSGSEPDTLPEVGQAVFSGCAGLGLSDCQTQTNNPSLQEHHAVQQPGGLADTVQKSKEVRASAGLMLGSLQPVVMRYLVRSCNTAVWSNVSAWETGWVLSEPQHPRSLRV